MSASVLLLPTETIPRLEGPLWPDGLNNKWLGQRSCTMRSLTSSRCQFKFCSDWWVGVKVCHFTCRRLVVSPQIHCMICFGFSLQPIETECYQCPPGIQLKIVERGTKRQKAKTKLNNLDRWLEHKHGSVLHHYKISYRHYSVILPSPKNMVRLYK
jgi:hypothetical protein